MHIAVIGAGVSGLACAYRLSQTGHKVTLLESGSYFGGHAHTVDVSLDGITHGVDTGFLVFNHRTYPQLVNLFASLGVDTAATDMSFSVKLPVGGRSLEWAGSNLDTVFAQRRNLFNPRFVGMLRDIVRFNRQTTELARSGNTADAGMSLGAFLRRHRYGDALRDWYLLPMAGCIWSCPTQQMLDFPIATFIRFCHNHGLLQISDRPQWHTVKGGSRNYVDRLLAAIPDKRLNTRVTAVTRIADSQRPSVRVDITDGTASTLSFDQVVLACHSDQALQLLTDATAEERALLGAIRYQPNRAVLHTDHRVLPQNRKTWSAWNYQSENKDGSGEQRVCVHYLINRLQPLPFQRPVIVSLNPLEEPAPGTVIDSYDYAHPVFDAAAIRAQEQLGTIQGRMNTWFAGAWTGYGFHEDGLRSGLAAAHAIERCASPVASLPEAA